ncbi:MAG: hypothetical protein Q8M31_20210 [Beijerinckiaceae bacterium]|nr:hypothetical protein [Beijerinckiaceae bacterium]
MATTHPVETIAKLLILTERRVQQLAREGILPKADHGRYELVPVVQAYVKYLRDRAIGAETPGEDGDHKRRLMKARADIAEFEAQRLSGDLVPVDQVEKTWTDIVARFRQRMLSVAPKAAPLVVVETSIDAAHDIIETLIHEGLAELAATRVEDLPSAEARGVDNAALGGASAGPDDL